MLRLFRIPGVLAAATILTLAAAQPADAAGGRNEARSAKPARAAAAPARAAVRPAVTASRRPVALTPAPRTAETARAPRAAVRTATRGAARTVTASRVTASRGSRAQARTARRVVERRQAFNLADRRGAQQARPGVRMVGLFSSPAAAATVNARGPKAGKPVRGEGGGRRGGVWHAGLPAADGEQMDCPSGTMAVLARGHADTFRCMPM